jgi:hypothetical protein
MDCGRAFKAMNAAPAFHPSRFFHTVHARAGKPDAPYRQWGEQLKPCFSALSGHSAGRASHRPHADAPMARPCRNALHR